MAEKRLILEMGTGNDLYGEDYTKAAIRAVQDCLHHSSLSLYKSLDLDPTKMVVNVTIGVQKPGQVDKDAVARQLPYGTVTVKAKPEKRKTTTPLLIKGLPVDRPNVHLPFTYMASDN